MISWANQSFFIDLPHKKTSYSTSFPQLILLEAQQSYGLWKKTILLAR